MSKYRRGTPRHNQWLASRGISLADSGIASRQIETFSGASRILPGTQVERLRTPEINGFMISINRYDGNDKVQVFIDDLRSERSVLDYVSLDDVDGFIERNTRRG